MPLPEGIPGTHDSPFLEGMQQKGAALQRAAPPPTAEARAKAGSAGELKQLLRREIDDLARRKALQACPPGSGLSFHWSCMCLQVWPIVDAHACAQGYEIPRDFIVEPDPFSKANHLLTDSGKPARGKLKAKCASCCRPSAPRTSPVPLPLCGIAACSTQCSHDHCMWHRPACRYGATMEQMYADNEARQKERARAIRQQAAGGSIEDKVKQVL